VGLQVKGMMGNLKMAEIRKMKEEMEPKRNREESGDGIHHRI
jgi:hypothetical protein